jgi:DNA polymerase-3 subunit epsilon
MKRIVLDIEATGVDVHREQRICEIGAIAFDEDYLPVSFYHQYVNPVIQVSHFAYLIHHLSNDFLRKFPRFHVIADSISQYIQGAEIYAHSAKNDRSWLNAELTKYKMPDTTQLGCRWIDTLKIAKKNPEIKQPGIDGLCDYYGIDRSAFRLQHGALTDCALLLSFLPLIEGHEEMGWEPEDICDWLAENPQLNCTRKFDNQ